MLVPRGTSQGSRVRESLGRAGASSCPCLRAVSSGEVAAPGTEGGDEGKTSGKTRESAAELVGHGLVSHRSPASISLPGLPLSPLPWKSLSFCLPPGHHLEGQWKLSCPASRASADKESLPALLLDLPPCGLVLSFADLPKSSTWRLPRECSAWGSGHPGLGSGHLGELADIPECQLPNVTTGSLSTEAKRSAHATQECGLETGSQSRGGTP